MRRNIVGIYALVVSIASIIVIWLLLGTIRNPVPDAASIQKIFFLPVEGFHPEPREHWRYVASVLAYPILCSLFLLLFSKLLLHSSPSTKRLHLILTLSSVVVLLSLAAAGLRNVHNI